MRLRLLPQLGRLMALAYTRRLGMADLNVANQFFLVALATPGETTIVRDIVIVQYDPLPANVVVYLEHPGTGAVWPLVYRQAMEPDTYHLELRQELVYGEQLVAATTEPNAYVYVTGYVFRA